MFYDILTTVVKDALKYRKVILVVFIFFGIAGLIAGLKWPKFYTSTATIFVEQKNILGPLMQGAAVQTAVVDRSKIAREIVYGNETLLKILQQSDWLEEERTPVEEEDLLNLIRKRLEITSTRKNLLHFSFKDTDPEKAYNTLSAAIDVFISESLATKLGESKAAYEFIDKQVQDYHAKLKIAEEELKKFRTENVDIRSGSHQEITNRIQGLQNKVAGIEQELRETKINKETLLAQLSGESATAAGLSKAEEYRARIIDLQSKLDTLLLTYHDTYPDVVRLKAQIVDLKNSLELEELDKQSGKTGKTITIEGIVVDERIQASPVYQQLRTDLYSTNTKIQTLISRLNDARESLIEQNDLGRRTHELEAVFAELKRDYQVNNDIYQDFLRRREAARVSMNVDLERKGLNLRVDEPPFVPRTPSGLGLKHILAISMLLGIVLPIGVIFGVLQIDPRIRNAEQLSVFSDVPIIGTVNEYYTSRETRTIKNSYYIIVILGFLSVVAIGFAALNLR